MNVLSMTTKILLLPFAAEALHMLDSLSEHPFHCFHVSPSASLGTSPETFFVCILL